TTAHPYLERTPCGSELVREGAGTSTEDGSSGIKPSRTSSRLQKHRISAIEDVRIQGSNVRSLTFLVRKKPVRAKAAHAGLFVQLMQGCSATRFQNPCKQPFRHLALPLLYSS
ncbi:hypothetical protein, partial [Pseudomonas amygdali]|uniref:hypothetical protein n=2 Tax=Pseudomonas amygdali TaxID=47877 RepID=UPI0019D3CE03